MTKPPAFQFYVKDWLSGTRRLSPAAKGYYIDLLAWSWENGSLPRSVKEIAREISADLKLFTDLWKKEIRRHWRYDEDGFINLRLERERKKSKVFKKMQSDKGKASAKQRLNRGSKSVQPEANRPGSTEGQPSFALALALSPSGDLVQEDQNHRRAERDGLGVDEREKEIKRLATLCHSDILRPYAESGRSLPAREPLIAAVMQGADAVKIPFTEATATIAVDRALKTWASKAS